MSKEVLDEKKLEKALKKLRSITHPKRIAIIRMLSEKPKMNVTQIYTKLMIEQAASSHHLKLLRLSGVLNANREGKEIYYSINQDNFQHLLECIDRCNE
jgi:ArsR family transcriptional regulator, virulence genes transcriptional regulator